jgi:hypothetical protein
MLASLTPHTWPFIALQMLHITGIALLLGNLVLLEVRVFGAGQALPVKDLARLSLSIAIVGFCLAAASGLLMFAVQGGALLANRVFTLKMLLLTAAGCNAAWFHGRGSLDKLDAVAKGQMLVSSAVWLAVMGCGRVLAGSH